MAPNDPDSYEAQQFRATAGTDNLDEYLKEKGHPGVPCRSWPKMPCDKAWDRIVRDRQLSKDEPKGLSDKTSRPRQRLSDEPAEQLTVKQWNELQAQRRVAQEKHQKEKRQRLEALLRIYPGLQSFTQPKRSSPLGSIEERVKALIALKLEEDYESVTSKFSLFHYLDEDSTMYCEFPGLFLSMEEEFGFAVPLDDENLYTVGDIVKYIEKKQSK
jgi:acyl carrier protein